jgi:oxygen-independent coproporphyrinogen III oxidase
MQGLYIHIPFCKKACHYCDFHFSTSLRHKNTLLQALNIEIKQKKSYLPHPTLHSVYFGGGTPSLLEDNDLAQIFETLSKHFNIDPGAEITLEANPDDITPEKVKNWKQQGINRLSIGIQSFFEEDLLWMNRAHNTQQAKTCVNVALQSGIENISADLIYGYPLLSNSKWEKNIDTLLQSGINHLSAYSLTVEPKTALAQRIKKGQDTAPKNEQAAHHFQMLLDAIQANGWQQYEISNYCKTNNYAVHNTNYWKNQPYIGIGPSAHSYNGNTRQWNVANNAAYTNALNANLPYFETEQLSPTDTFNEYVMTGLRTKWGIELNYIETRWGTALLQYAANAMQPFLNNGYMLQNNNTIILSREGKLMADYIASELFWVADE